jgi:hypothetical protein
VQAKLDFFLLKFDEASTRTYTAPRITCLPTPVEPQSQWRWNLVQDLPERLSPSSHHTLTCLPTLSLQAMASLLLEAMDAVPTKSGARL